ncbi:ABC transporter substrate-binding protein [Neorhizobium lilium]|nr:ABC transporter substrate-binding protein [Neorhizobium lilium]
MRKKLLQMSLAAAAMIAVGASSGMAAELDKSLHDMLPDDIKTSGEVKVGTEPQAPPYDYYANDNTTIIGLEQDLIAEMSARLGIKFTVLPSQFASIIPGIQAGRFDIGMSAMGDFVERQKIVDIIDYTLEGTSIVVLEGNPHNIAKLKDACGLRAGAVQGSIPLELLDKQKTLCPADKPLEVMQFPSNDQIKIALRSGRVDLSMDTTGVAAFSFANQPASDKKLALVEGVKYAAGYQGIMVGKKDTHLRDAIVATLQKMIDDGSYARIFDKYKLGENMIKTITVNDGARFADYLKLDE